MANTFKNYTSASVGTSPVTTYTVPASTTSVTIGLTISNTTASQIKIDVQAAGVFIIKDAPIPSGSALSVLDGKVILEAADTVVVTSDTATSADVILSVLEQT
jgi:biopolymer transport protein ExbD